MRVRMFKPQFAPLVKRGKKRNTIRPLPKRKRDQPKIGDLESWRMWRGKPYRSKQVKLATVRLVDVVRTTIRRDGVMLKVGKHKLMMAEFTELGRQMLEAFARADGFRSWSRMKAWFEHEHGLPFTGNSIKAEDA